MTSNSSLLSVWQALDTWAKGLKPWQRRILAYATRDRSLNEGQIAEIYQLFLDDAKVQEAEKRDEIAIAVTGRPANEAAKSMRLERITNLSGFNALPEGSCLTFGPALTVIYGRNGAGKSGFARLFANACFSRHRPSILANIYDDTAPSSPTGTIHVSIDGAGQEFPFTTDSEHPELRRISYFDDVVARHHVSQSTPFEFKPSGFDVFPEMARVCRQIGTLLDADIKSKTHDTIFSDSFIGVETVASKAIASIGGSTDLAEIRALAIYSQTEISRLAEVDIQLTALKSRSPKEVLAQLGQAHSDVAQLAGKLATLGQAFTADKGALRTSAGRDAKEAADAASVLGSEQFKRPFFSAVGTPEWQTFTKAAHALGRKEGPEYPAGGDRCLLCERPFDDASKNHVAALLSFVEGDAQKKAERAVATLQNEVRLLQELDFSIFAPESRVREHVHRIDPSVEIAIANAVASMQSLREKSIEALTARNSLDEVVDVAPVNKMLADLIARIAADTQRLEKEDSAAAIASLELERRTLRHREVLRVCPERSYWIA